MLPAMRDVMKDYDIIEIEANMEEGHQFCVKYKVDVVPTLLFLDNKKEIGRATGPGTYEQIVAKIQSMSS